MQSSPTLPSSNRLFDLSGKLIFELPDTKRPDHPSSLMFAMHRSGSTMTEGILGLVAKKIGLPYVGISNEFFRHGVNEVDHPRDTEHIFRSSGYIYGGFRFFPTSFQIPILNACPSILLVRDPRDAVTSLYFAEAKSHALPESGRERDRYMSLRQQVQGTDIDAYVLDRAPIFLRRLIGYKQALNGLPNNRVYRYEDIIFDKIRFVSEMSDHCGWGLSAHDIREVVAPYDIVPDQERPDQHVRQVKPGNYKQKLAPETVEQLTEMFAPALRMFNYET